MSYGPVPLNDTHTLFGNYPATSTGIRVDNYSAECNYVFRRGVEVIAQSMAKICRKWRLWHVDAAGKRTELRDIHHRLMTRAANHYTTAYSLWELVLSWAKGWGNGYAWILRRNDGQPLGLFPLHPSRVTPRVVRNENIESPWPWDLVYQIDGGRAVFLPYEVLHIKGNPGFDGVTGYNLVQLHENTLAIAQAQNEFSGEFFQNGAVAGGLVELPATLKPDVVQKYKRDFQDRYSSRGNRHLLAVVDSGVKFTSTTIDPQAAQLLEARKFSIYEIAMLLGVPPTVLGDLSHGTFANTEQQQLAMTTLTLHPIAENCRQELDLKMTPEPPAASSEYATWDYDNALKALDAADTSTRMDYLHTAVGGPWMSMQEAREEDGLPQEINGQIYPPPNMNAPMDTPPAGKSAEETDPEDADGTEVDPSGDDPDQAEPKPSNQAERSAPPPQGLELRTAPAPEPVDGRASLAARAQVARALEPVFRDVLQRLATKEARAIAALVRHLRDGHTDVFARKTDEFFAKHQAQVEAAFRPALQALSSQVRACIAQELRTDNDAQPADDAAAASYAAALAARHVDQARASLAELLTGQQESAAAADAIDAHMAGWPGCRAEATNHEIRQAAGYFARAAYRAAGCTALRWVYHQGDPEECRALDGKTVAIDEPFLADPPRHHPPLAPECHCGIVGQ